MTDHKWNEAVAAPTPTKRQHVVPQFWLSAFAQDGRIQAFDLEAESIFETSTENLAVIARFYDFKQEDDTLSAESWLADLEGKTVPIMASLRDDPSYLTELSNSDEDDLAQFIAAQILRSPAERSQEDSMRRQMVDQVKEIGKAWLFKNHSKAEADGIWSAWEAKPDEFFLHEDAPYQPASTTASMLGETQGFANALRAMRWRIGKIDHGSLNISDAGVSKRAVPTHRFKGFASHTYSVPLSPSVAVEIGPGIPDEENRYERRVKDFSRWETTLMNHAATMSAERFIYGSKPFVGRKCSTNCMRSVLQAKFDDAVMLQGFDPALFE